MFPSDFVSFKMSLRAKQFILKKMTFHLPDNEHEGWTHFHMIGFTWRLVLTQTRKNTRYGVLLKVEDTRKWSEQPCSTFCSIWNQTFHCCVTHKGIYCMTSFVSEQDELNLALWLATRAGQMELSCPLGIRALSRKENLPCLVFYLI